MNEKPIALPYEAGASRPGLFPGDLVIANSVLAVVTEARVVIDGTVFNWNAALPLVYKIASIPSYLLTCIEADIPMPQRWCAHQLILVKRGHAWDQRKDITKEYP